MVLKSSIILLYIDVNGIEMLVLFGKHIVTKAIVTVGIDRK